MAVKLEDLTPGAQVTGIAPGAIGKGQPVTVVAATWIGGNAIRLTFRTSENKFDERILYREHEEILTWPRLARPMSSALTRSCSSSPLRRCG